VKEIVVRYVVVLGVLVLAACGPITRGPEAARQRAEAAADVPENHPHPPAGLVPIPGSFSQLRCWNNGEDIVCTNTSN
jgi:hypothetical protein